MQVQVFSCLHAAPQQFFIAVLLSKVYHPEDEKVEERFFQAFAPPGDSLSRADFLPSLLRKSRAGAGITSNHHLGTKKEVSV